jgi:hypothetical protein
MTHRLLVSACLLAVVYGCGRESAPTDLTQAALYQVRSGQYDEAIVTASEAIRANPQAAAAYLYRGRAYQFRNAMGDHPRALADFSEAIRLAPESSDAYYSRALVYRDIGQTDLATADDAKARELDGLAKETYDQLPDLTPSSAVAKAGNNDLQTKSAARKPDPLLEGEEVEPGFGELRTPSTQKESKSAGGATEDSLTERYRSILGTTTDSSKETPPSATSDSGTSTPGAFGQFGQFGQPAPAVPEAAPGGAVAPGLPMSLGPSSDPLRPRGNFQGPQLPPVTSPFAQRPAVPSMNELPPAVHSPFPQRAPGATGYVEPVNPFGARPGQSAASRPATAPAPSTRFPNQAVRPDNPRDYLP